LRRGFFCKEITMTIEVLVDENGTILALSTAHEGKEPARRRAREQRDEEGVTLRPPTVKMQPRAGQQHHLIALPAELEGMPLKEIHSGFRLVHGVDGPRLESITG
jgi:hypothetical protein